MKYSFFLLFIVTINAVGCKKDSSESSEETKTEIITKSSWKYDNAGGDLDKNGSIDVPPPGALLQPCIIDNFIIFQANGTAIIDEGATKCDPLLTQTTAATWSFSNNETTLNLSGSGLVGLSGQFKILLLTNTQLHLSKDTTVTGIPLAFIVQLKH